MERDPDITMDRAATTEPGRALRSTPTSQAAIQLDPGARVGRYIVRKAIGEGGMGTVYLAHDPDLDRLVAIKLVHDADREAQAQLLAEAKATARFAHPNVVAVHDVGPHDDGFFIALEYVQGGTLRGWLTQTQRPWPQIVEALAHAGRGLEVAHEAGLVHRDFKPDNVLIGHDGRVRVADFGLARGSGIGEAQVSGDEAGFKSTIPGVPMAGTPGYMAPEQVRGLAVDARTDVFAFCVTLWEALAGERPFGGQTFADHVHQLLGGERRAFPRDTGVPPTIIQALCRGLAIDPDERWATMGELLAALAGALGEASADSLRVVRPYDDGREAAMPAAIGARYRLLEPLADGTLGAVFLARDRLGGHLVAIKRAQALVMPSTIDGRPSPRLQIARELRARLALRHPGLVTLLDFGFDDEEVSYFVLELEGNARPLLAAAGDQPLAIQIHLIAQLLRALIYLHRQGRVGVDLDNHTVIVVGDALKVIDTEWSSLAISRARAQRLTCAPELAAGGAPSIAADLYAVGMLLLALLEGRPTLEARARDAAMISAVQSGEGRRALAIDERLAPLLGRLIAEDPRERPASAAEALSLLAAATALELPRETVHTRESFLQAGRLVGRESELERLIHDLRAALRGRGATILVGGESGVGKSRLVDEVRALGILHGAVVLRGHAIAEGGRVLDAFRALLRWLAISSPLSDLEASVLRLGVPDIDLLIGRSVPSAPELDASSGQLRLLQVVLAVLRRQVRPIVVLLEDLHWARSESLALLSGITREGPDLRLFVVATYRDDEAPRLHAAVPGASRLRLGRLGPASIAEVAAAMIGDAGRRPALVELLMRETEGNALFVVEAMRALAEEVGALERVGEGPLPASIAAGGVRRVILRRLARLAEPVRRVLEVAAVIGRDLDEPVLAAVAGAEDLAAHLEAAAEAAILEREGPRWRFTHDKLREALLEGLAADRRRALHAAIAEALEARGGDLRDDAEALALHYRAIDRRDRELVHVARAGERRIRTSPREGIELLGRALELGGHQLADPITLARWQRQIADAHFILGDLPAARERFRQALRALGVGWPRGTIGWSLLLLRQLVVQAMYVRRRRPRIDEAARARNLEASRAAGRATQIHLYTFEQVPLIAASLLSLGLAQRAGGTNARSIAFVAYAAGLVGWVGLAERYFAEGRTLPDDDAAAKVDLDLMHCVFATARADLARAAERGEAGLAAARRAGYALGVAQGEGMLGCIDYLRGDLHRFHDRYRHAVDALRGSESGHGRGIEWGLCWAQSELGRGDEALARVEAILADTPEHEKLHLSMIHALRAALLSRRGDHEAAVRAADATMRSASPASVPGNTPIILLGPAEAYLGAWSAILRGAGGDARPLRTRARKQARALALWARLAPIGRPFVDLVGGHIDLLDGKQPRAQARFTAALGQAEALQLRGIVGLAHLALAQVGEPGDRRRHHEAASELLRRCGAEFRLAAVPPPR